VVLADSAAAADVVQTVFVSLLRQRARPELTSVSAARVRNECSARCANGGGMLLASAAPILETVEAERPADERLALERALRELPADQREVVHLKVFEA